eukprot:13970316-Alexandrium_andersonii.AAC.1
MTPRARAQPRRGCPGASGGSGDGSAPCEAATSTCVPSPTGTRAAAGTARAAEPTRLLPDPGLASVARTCLLYTSDAADDM